MEPMLSVKNLTKRFGGLTAVNQVSMDVHPGEVVGLVGDNGAGKSTLIKMVSGVYQPNDGEIFFEGKRVNISKPSDAREMGIETIYQDLALAGNLDVGANIFLGREHKRTYLGGLVHVLDDRFMQGESGKLLVDLDVHIPSLRQKIDKLSGGQRQAVAIARAIYWNARLMIMDEPTNNLGVAQQGEVLALIRRLRSGRAGHRHQPHHPRHLSPSATALWCCIAAQGRRQARGRDQSRGDRAVHHGRARRLPRQLTRLRGAACGLCSALSVGEGLETSLRLSVHICPHQTVCRQSVPAVEFAVMDETTRPCASTAASPPTSSRRTAT